MDRRERNLRVDVQHESCSLKMVLWFERVSENGSEPVEGVCIDEQNHK